MKYRKKPVVIEAVKASDLILCLAESPYRLPQWAIDAYENGTIRAVTSEGFTIENLEGNHMALPDDMVIQGVKGEL